MEDYKPNSYKYKEQQKQELIEERKVQKVVSGPVKIKKKSGVTKFADVFISEDASNVKSYILMDVLVPAIKKAVSDIVKDGIDMILYGESGRSKKSGVGSKVSYGSYYKNDRDRDGYRRSESRNIYNYDEIIFNTRGEAEMVLDQLDEIIERYSFAKVADLYDLAGISMGGNYTANNYGWTNLQSAKVIPVRDGYLIKLPRALPID